jgi:hypothetical protein
MARLARDTSLIDRVLLRVTISPSGCWEFGGAIASTGYGVINYKGVVHYVHRLVYQELVDEIPPGLHIDHLCRNRKCCFPDHLDPVTQRENMARGFYSTGVARESGCPLGHSWTDENVYRRPGSGSRQCYECIRRRSTAHAAKRKGALQFSRRLLREAYAAGTDPAVALFAAAAYLMCPPADGAWVPPERLDAAMAAFRTAYVETAAAQA